MKLKYDTLKFILIILMRAIKILGHSNKKQSDSSDSNATFSDITSDEDNSQVSEFTYGKRKKHRTDSRRSKERKSGKLWISCHKEKIWMNIGVKISKKWIIMHILDCFFNITKSIKCIWITNCILNPCNYSRLTYYFCWTNHRSIV